MIQPRTDSDPIRHVIDCDFLFKKDIIDRIPVAILVLDHSGTVIYGNRFFSRRSGIPMSLITGKKFNAHPIMAGNDGSSMTDSIAVKTPAAIINSMVCDGGKKVIFKWETSEIQRPDNEKKCTLCIGRDVTHEKELEIKLRRARKTIEEWSKTFFEKNAIPQLLVMDGKIIDCNTKALELLGMTSKKKLIDLNPADISPERQSSGLLSREKAESFINKAITDGFIEFEWVHRKTNGKDLHVLVSLSAHEIEGNKIVHAVWTDITERKKTEEALIESEKRFRAIFMGSSDGILLIDGETETIIDCNPRALEMFGYENKDLTNVMISDLSPLLQADGVPSKDKGIEHLIKAYSNEYDRFEWLHQCTNGEMFPAEIMLSRVDLGGEKAILATVRDITHNKQAEFKLKQSEERYRNLADMAFEGILIHDNGTTLDVNLTFCKMFGYDRDELIGKNAINMIIHKEYRALAYLKAKTQDISTYEALSIKKDGSLLWIEIFGKPYIHDGKIVRVVATRDISDRKMIENILRKSEEKFRRITESSLNELIITDEKGVILFISPSITRYSGFKTADLVGKKFLDMFPDNMAAKISGHMHDAIAGKTVGLFESNMLRADGSTAYIEASIVMTAGTNGKRELEIYMRDISEQKQLQQEIIRLSEAERRKIGQNLHDGLGQVLTGISIMIGTVARKIKLNKSVTYDEMIRIAQKVEEAIDTTRLTARGLYPVTLEKGGLISALREMAINVENSFGARCRVFNQGKDTAPDLNTSCQLYYIVQEAINNAIRHGKARKIDIDIVIKKKVIRLTVANDITAKSRKKKSDGMGLRIMEYRAEMIGGTFSVKSKSTSFRVDIEIIYQ